MTNEQLLNWLELFTSKINENKELLNELDTPIGDGDHGTNMARGTTEMMKALSEKQPDTTVDTLKIVAMTLISKVGGASGPLYGSAFMGMMKVAKEGDDLVAMLEGGLADIEKRGKAVVGEKTMLDTWVPVIDALKNKELTLQKIQDAAEATKDIKATKGRASYLGDRSLGHMDPGALSSAYLFEAMLEAEVV